MNLLCCCTMAPNTKITRKWELFAGRNKFYCDGFLMSAPHTGVFYLTCFLITGTSALFFAFDCPYLATKITPAIPIVGAILYFFTMSSLLRTTFTDPGVIPRASHDEAAYIEKQIEVPNSLNSPTYRPPPRTKEVLVKGQTVKLKYCFTCKIFRPPRASHCSLCDNCVDRFDHHCPWVGNCVGKRNYRFFYMFLVSLAFLAVFIFSCSITHLVLLMKNEQEVFEVIKKAPFSVFVTIICFFSIWSVIGLAGFHTYLTTSDQTTNEDLKGSFSSKGGQRAMNPYSRGNICLNCFHILCGPMTPSLIDRRGVVTDEYILQMHHTNLNQNPNNQLVNLPSTTSPALITSQPVLVGIDSIASAKQRLYEDVTPSTGIYRHRSYDNLQNGNSNSLAHLVDNEIPLSTLESPVPLNDGLPITPTVDDDNIEAMNKRLNNLSGSYNNLFRDNLDNYNEDIETEMKQKNHSTHTNAPQQQTNQINNSNNVHDLIASHIVISPGVTSTSANMMTMNKSASESENVYSNIPNLNIPSPAISSNDSNRSDPNLHVYSNLIEENQQQQQQNMSDQNLSSSSSSILTATTVAAVAAAAASNTISKSYDLVTSAPTNLVKSISSPQQHHDDVLDDSTIIPSTLLSDDLDLDDPVSAFAANKRKKYDLPRHTRQGDNRKSSESDINNQSIPMIGSEKKTIDVTTTLPTVNILPLPTTGTSSNNTAATIPPTNPNNTRESSNYITPSRLKLLHDTTMIDTALDLDSLDGSSIGNNSQACLVKTAMV